MMSRWMEPVTALIPGARRGEVGSASGPIHIGSARLPSGQSGGTVVRSDGQATALVLLDGCRTWLESEESVSGLLARWSGLLAGGPLQVGVRRRRTDLSVSQAGWEVLVSTANIPAASVARVSTEYLGGVLPLARDSGIARVQAWLGVPGRSAAEAVTIAAGIAGRIGYGARVGSPVDVSDWVADWLGVAAMGQQRPSGEAPIAPVLVQADGFSEESVRLGNGRLVRLWRCTSLPLECELGWLRHLLGEPALASLEFDIVFNSVPCHDQHADGRALRSRVRSVDAQLAQLAAQQRSPRNRSWQLLAETRAELMQRLEASSGGRAGVRESHGWLAVRLPVGADGAQINASSSLAGALRRLGFGPVEVNGRRSIRDAWMAVGPVWFGAPSSAPPLVTTAERLAPANWLAVAPGQPAVEWPVLDVTVERTAALGLAVVRSHDHVVVTGDHGSGAPRSVFGWAATLAMAGASVVLFDRQGQWAAPTIAQGGVSCHFGPTGFDGVDLAGLGPELVVNHRGDSAVVRALHWRAVGVERLSGGENQETRVNEIIAQRQGRYLPVDWDEFHGHVGLSPTCPGGPIANQALPGAWCRARPAANLGGTRGIANVSWSGDVSGWPMTVALAVRSIIVARLADPARIQLPGWLVFNGFEELIDNSDAVRVLEDVVRAARLIGLRLWFVTEDPGLFHRSAFGRVILAHAHGRATFCSAHVPAEVIGLGLGWPDRVARGVRRLPTDTAMIMLDGARYVSWSIAARLFETRASDVLGERVDASALDGSF